MVRVRQVALRCSLPQLTSTSLQEAPEATVCIPYIKGTAKHIRRILAEHNMRTRLKSYNTLRQCLSHPKDRISLDNKSGVVYSIPCKDCTITYLGETGIHLSTRLKQHKEALKRGELEKSAVATHAWNLHHRVDWEGVSIIDQDSNTISRKIRESLHIRRRSGLMNRDDGLEISHTTHVCGSLYSLLRLSSINQHSCFLVLFPSFTFLGSVSITHFLSLLLSSFP